MPACQYVCFVCFGSAWMPLFEAPCKCIFISNLFPLKFVKNIRKKTMTIEGYLLC